MGSREEKLMNKLEKVENQQKRNAFWHPWVMAIFLLAAIHLGWEIGTGNYKITRSRPGRGRALEPLVPGQGEANLRPSIEASK